MPTGSGVTVLVVEDHDMIRDMIADALTWAGYEVLCAATGSKAMALFRDGARPSVVITDIIMPDGEGLELIRHIRKVSPASRINAISGGGMIDGTNYLETATLFGADAVFQKPFGAEELLASVRLQVQKSATAD